MYPLFLNLSGRFCLVVGAGSVGFRKITALLSACPAVIRIVDPAPGEDVVALVSAHEAAAHVPLAESATQEDLALTAPETPPVVRSETETSFGRVRLLLLQRTFEPADIAGATLVFAATGNRSVNAAVQRACRAAGILCNCADDPEGSDFMVPASIRRSHVHVALSTSGASPALTRVMREELEAWIGDRYDALSELLSRLRPLVLAMGLETGQNTALFRRLVRSSLGDCLRRRDRDACETILKRCLPSSLHSSITELLHDLA